MKRKDYIVIAVIALMVCTAIIIYAFKSNSGGIVVQTAVVSISEETVLEDDEDLSKSRSGGNEKSGPKLTSANKEASRKTASDDKLASRRAESEAKEQSKLAAAAARAESQAALWFDVNRVTKEELMLIDGVDEVLADIVIETRGKINGYAEIIEIRKIMRVSQTQFEILEPHLYIDPATARVDGEVEW